MGLGFQPGYLTVIPRARMGHEGERNNCFSKIQLVGQKYRDKTTLATILDKIKWNSKPPSPPPPPSQIKDEAVRRAKTRYFPILD